MARSTKRRSNVHSIVYDLPGAEVTLPAKGPNGPYRSGPKMGTCGNGLIRYVSYDRYVLVMVDCFSRWTEACPLPDKTAHSVADAFFNQVVCRFSMPIVIHSDQGREQWGMNKIMQELCILCGSHKTRTTPYHPESDGLVECFNRTLLMMLAMFAGKNREDWDDLLPAVMMAYRSSVHESTGFSPYWLMFGEECTLPMDIGLPKQQSDLSDSITSPYAIWVRDALEVAYDQVHQHSGQAVQHEKRLYDRSAVKRLFAVGDWVMRYYTPAKKCKLDSAWIGPYLIVSLIGWALGLEWSAVGHSSRTVPKGGNVFLERSEYFLGTAGDCDVPNSLDPDGGGTSIRVANERTTGRITGCTSER